MLELETKRLQEENRRLRDQLRTADHLLYDSHTTSHSHNLSHIPSSDYSNNFSSSARENISFNSNQSSLTQVHQTYK